MKYDQCSVISDDDDDDLSSRFKVEVNVDTIVLLVEYLMETKTDSCDRM